MLYLEFGQDRLAEAHPLNAFELAQGAIEVAFEGSRRSGANDHGSRENS